MLLFRIHSAYCDLQTPWNTSMVEEANRIGSHEEKEEWRSSLGGFWAPGPSIATTLIKRSFNTHVNGMKISLWRITKKTSLVDKYRDNAIIKVCYPAEREHLSPVSTSPLRNVQIKAGFHWSDFYISINITVFFFSRLWHFYRLIKYPILLGAI